MPATQSDVQKQWLKHFLEENNIKRTFDTTVNSLLEKLKTSVSLDALGSRGSPVKT